jgi:hypothetical protein
LKNQIGVCVGLLLLGFGAAGTAQAQPAYEARGFLGPVLPPREIISVVRSSGLRPLTRPLRRGPNYVLVAIDRAGRQMRVAVDAQLGDIVNLRPALAGESFGPEIAAPNGPADDYPYPTPPRSIPNGRMANAPNAISPPMPPPLPSIRPGVAEPGLPPPPPLPRPRPGLAASEAPSEAPAPLPAVKPPSPSAPSAPAKVEEPAAPIE